MTKTSRPRPRLAMPAAPPIGTCFRAILMLITLPLLPGTAGVRAEQASGSGGAPSVADVDPAAVDFFERRIRPVLVERCYSCHSADADPLQGGLRVDDAAAMRSGGDSGEVIAPGDPDSSLMLAALRYEGMEMPPDEPLPDDVIEDFQTWIRSGAAMPASSHAAPTSPEKTPGIDWDSARSFWAFQPPTRHDVSELPPPPQSFVDWAKAPLDRFVLARLQQHELHPNAPADKRVWLRRVTFDLIGLPPSPSEVRSFVSDASPLAKERVVERLLSSPQHAERWARLWLDVARYAEDQAHIVGNNDSLTYPNAYLYRDWVIRSLAEDLPYDQFVQRQLAADLMFPESPQEHVALGFIGLGPKYYRRNDLEVMADEWEDRVDTLTRGLLGLTVACARCHDHKYDPIPTSDYYALAGVFASTEMYNRPLDESVETKNGQAKKPQDAVHIIREGKPQDLQVMIRGDAKRLGQEVPRGFLTVLGEAEAAHFESGSGRKELAEAIVDADNPLAARVIVNRVWHQLIGTPLVATPSNFGSLGARPSHPQLLDDLAVRFMQHDWSLKWLQREIVLSATYGQNSGVDPDKAAKDPDNRFLWRMPRRRLSVEAYRDAILSVAGRLDPVIGGRSIDPSDVDSGRRTVYSEVSRLDLNPLLARFDFPDPNAHSPVRHETTTPLQKLFLLNSPFLLQHSQALADRIAAQASTRRARISVAYQWLFARQPDEEEMALAEAFLGGPGDELSADDVSGVATSGKPSEPDQRWVQLAQALLISNEMFMVD
ncbi:DUF1553 domain-containing protein [Roseiconus nitratireducens]|uniref:DUF1553 domain-containing protein n=1 Tax=Roseiconus nitratireducens TaxID=2605748 RepID=A0A5M6D5E9_9BACT|nr:PSD1 and planctomycete cytochrome C domain-containing protein [Roseiconus nitratireducens]KAA5542734.1 DUF1553 domain-containing protein [Roseiconus nitratireducens]